MSEENQPPSDWELLLTFLGTAALHVAFVSISLCVGVLAATISVWIAEELPGEWYSQWNPREYGVDIGISDLPENTYLYEDRLEGISLALRRPPLALGGLGLPEREVRKVFELWKSNQPLPDEHIIDHILYNHDTFYPPEAVRLRFDADWTYEQVKERIRKRHVEAGQPEWKERLRRKDLVERNHLIERENRASITSLIGWIIGPTLGLLILMLLYRWRWSKRSAID